MDEREKIPVLEARPGRRLGKGVRTRFGVFRGGVGLTGGSGAAIACTQFLSPKGEPRLTLLRTALSSAEVSGLLTRSVQGSERAIG